MSENRNDDSIERLLRMAAATEGLEIETSIRLDEFNSAMRDRADEWDILFAAGPDKLNEKKTK